MCLWILVSLEHFYLFSVENKIFCRVQPCGCLTSCFSLVKFLPFLFHECIEFMEVDIRKNGRDHSTLWRATVRLVVLPIFDISRFEHVADKVKELSIFNSLL